MDEARAEEVVREIVRKRKYSWCPCRAPSVHLSGLLDPHCSERWAKIGNSVPPLLMKAMAETIRRNIQKDGRRFVAA